MSKETLDKAELLTEIDKAIHDFIEPANSLDPSKFNTVPYKDSWTVGQLFDHIIKSMRGLSDTLAKPAKPAEREPDERVPELKKIFLDFSQKLNAPDFIVPGNGPFEKENSISALKQLTQQLIVTATNLNSNELLEGLPLGPITKIELLHFVLYHTKRHTNQMQRIVAAL